MKIESLKVHAISVDLGRWYWVSRFPLRTATEMIVEIRTSDGITGYGVIHNRPQKEIVAMIEALSGEIIGMDALAHEDVWWKLFSLTTTRYGFDLERKTKIGFGETKREQILAALAGIDIALWDIKGKAAKMPVWRLLGGSKREIFAYASGGYYEEGTPSESIGEEMASYVEAGFKAVKIKVGGATIEEDVKRLREARAALGSASLMIDANCAYDIETATRAIHAFEPYDIFWYEEPLQWYDSIRGLGRLATRTKVPIASGESELTSWACRDLIEVGGVRFMQFDATKRGGITEWLRIAAYCHAHGVWLAPHHDPQIHGHLLSASANAFGVETFTRSDRDPVWEGLFTNRPEIKNGTLYLTEAPGFGVDINWDFVKRHKQ
jgi:L-alanine-DL-glutamate epimerase-like enolase superfamily enzyme